MGIRENFELRWKRTLKLHQRFFLSSQELLPLGVYLHPIDGQFSYEGLSLLGSSMVKCLPNINF